MGKAVYLYLRLLTSWVFWAILSSICAAGAAEKFAGKHNPFQLGTAAFFALLTVIIVGAGIANAIKKKP